MKKTPKNHSETKKHLSKLDGGGNSDLTQSMRNHPTYKKPKLSLVK